MAFLAIYIQIIYTTKSRPHSSEIQIYAGSIGLLRRTELSLSLSLIKERNSIIRLSNVFRVNTRSALKEQKCRIFSRHGASPDTVSISLLANVC